MTTPLVALAISSPEHIRAWHAVMDLARVTPHNSWTVVGGSMVYLHCAERDRTSPRETTDVDAMLNAREFPNILMDVTTALKSGGFASAPGASMDGHHHRWELAGARVDLLIPRGIGPRLAAKKGADGGTTIQSPGGLQALERAESIDLLVGGREARISRPSLLDAIVGKAAVYGITQDPNRERHLHDLAIPCGLIAARDNLSAITARDRKHLIPAVSHLEPRLDAYGIPDADLGLERLIDEIESSRQRDLAEDGSDRRIRREARKGALRQRTYCGVRTRHMLGPCLKPRGHDPREPHSSV